MADNNYVEFRFRANVTCDISEDGTLFMPPMRQVRSHSPEGYEIVRPEFDMNAIHRLRLPSGMAPTVPKKRPEWDTAFFAAVRAEAFARAIRARAEADKLRQRLLHFIRVGTITVTNDPSGFLDDDLGESDIAQTVAARLLKQNEAA